MKNLSVILLAVMISASMTAQDKSSSEVKLYLTGLHCENCVAKVEKALEDVKGVREATVELTHATVILESPNAAASDALVKAVADAGYGASLTKVEPKTNDDATMKHGMKKGMKHEMKDMHTKGKGSCEGDCCDKPTKEGTKS